MGDGLFQNLMDKQKQPSFDTVSETINWLKQQGYTHDFNLDEDCLLYNNGKTAMSPEDFRIDQFYRFEGDTDPGDEAIVYAISSETFGIRGVLSSAFGVYADSLSRRMIEKLAVR